MILFIPVSFPIDAPILLVGPPAVDSVVDSAVGQHDHRDDRIDQDCVADDADATPGDTAIFRVDDDTVRICERVVGYARGDAMTFFHVFAAMRPVDPIKHSVNVMRFVTTIKKPTRRMKRAHEMLSVVGAAHVI